MDLTEHANLIAQRLQALESAKLVLAESCTGGMAAALLTRVPGISELFCGSTVVYRESTKTTWLCVSAEVIANHTAESAETTEALARGVLNLTPEARFAGSITGHLGPSTASELDGIIFTCFAMRDQQNIRILGAKRYRLNSKDRADRQQEAAQFLLQEIQHHLRQLISR